MPETTDSQTCPICHQPNHCQVGCDHCWCADVKVPQELIDRLPEEKQGSTCICRRCIDRFNQENRAN